MAEGWIKLNRQIQEHWLWKDEPFDKARAWIDLIMLANYEDKKVAYKGEVIICKRGDVNLSLQYLARRWKWSTWKVRNFFGLLESDQMITTNRTTHRTTITIVNYDNFQDLPTTSHTTNRTADHTTSHTQATTTKEIKERKEIKDIVEYLNDRAGTSYKPSTANTVKHINARLNEGYSVEDFKTVIDTKVKEWKGNPKMEKFLRPDTLFGSKFESYLNQGGKNNEQLVETSGLAEIEARYFNYK